MSSRARKYIPLDAKLLREVERLLEPDMSVTQFIEAAVDRAVARRRFLKKGVEAAERARISGHYISSAEVLSCLAEILAKRKDSGN